MTIFCSRTNARLHVAIDMRYPDLVEGVQWWTHVEERGRRSDMASSPSHLPAMFSKSRERERARPTPTIKVPKRPSFDRPFISLPIGRTHILIASSKSHIFRTMLASPFYTQPTTYNYQREFLPKIPSPLSPRSANIYGGARQQQPIFMSDDLNKQQSSAVPYSKRAIKRAPAVSQDALKERRRGMFLKKVREGREDKRFEKHGEDVSWLSPRVNSCKRMTDLSL